MDVGRSTAHTGFGAHGTRVLVIDVGGTHVKFVATAEEARKFDSGRKLTARKMIARVQEHTRDWSYEVVSIGYPGPLLHGRIAAEPHNLGSGWMGVDFGKAFGCPVKLINDAAMQALGGYRGGRMLFLGLGTGLGSALIVDGIVEPLELAHLPYKKGTYEDYLGKHALHRDGKKKWRKHVAKVIERFRTAFEPDDILLGGGNAKKLTTLPDGCRRGANTDAFVGGFRLWAHEMPVEAGPAKFRAS